MSDDDVLTFDVSHLMVAEIEEIEERSGKPIQGLADPEVPRGTLYRAIGYVMRRRTDPNFTWEQAGELKVVFSALPVPTGAASD